MTLRQNFARKLWDRLTAPHPSITDVEQQRQARLLSAFALLLFAVLIVSILPLTITLAVGITSIVFLWHRNGVEADRRAELERVNQELRHSQTALERRVQERTGELETVLRVSANATSILDLDQLLPTIVNLTKQRFGLYHAHIYLLDETGQKLTLAAGAGEIGERMRASQHRIPFNAQHSLVARTARTRQGILVNDVAQEPDFLPNPMLPDTRAELAAPMVVGDQLFGVLDVQSDKPARFTNDDEKVMAALAEQAAIAVRNAQLFAQSKEAQAAAERANQVKSAFLASMSHELRTPLNAIINFSKFITRGVAGAISDKQRDLLNKVIASAEHLLNLINDVLDMSKIESGSLKLFVEPDVDVNSICDAAINTSKALIADKPVILNTEVTPNLPHITGDKQRLLQVLLNILSNAAKFTRTGTITVGAQCQDSEIVLSVADSGPGIPREEWGLVFEPFKQTESGLRQGGGTGLGMPITKSLVEAHGGRIWLDSAVGKGTTFYVALPINSSISSAKAA